MSPGSAMCSLNCKPHLGSPTQQLAELELADLQGLGTQVLAIEFQEVEGEQEHSTILPPVAQPIEARQTLTVTGHRFPIEQE